VVLLSVKNPPHHTTTLDVITFKATSKQPRKPMFGLKPYFDPIRINIKEKY
jgi:hypothetical protein